MKNQSEICDCNEVHNENVLKAKESIPDDNDIKTLSEFFKILGDPTRLRVLWSLENEELCVCDVAETLGMTKSAISHQLGILRQAKLVKNRREGKNIFYSLDDSHVVDIIETAITHIHHSWL